jgi:hypothetical protein
MFYKLKFYINKLLISLSEYKIYCKLTFEKVDKDGKKFIDNHYYQSIVQYPLNDWRLMTSGKFITQKIVIKKFNK